MGNYRKANREENKQNNNNDNDNKNLVMDCKISLFFDPNQLIYTRCRYYVKQDVGI